MPGTRPPRSLPLRAGAQSALETAAPSILRRVGDWLRPDLTSPSAPLATTAWLDSFEPSLMPRTSLLQGLVGGLAVLSARTVASGTERALAPALGGRHEVPRRLAVRAAVAAAGIGLSRLPEREGERLWWSGLRGGGEMLRSVAVGGAIHDVGYATWATQVRASRPLVRTVVATASVVSGLSLWAEHRLRQRTAAVEPWPVVEQRTTLWESAAVSAAVVLAGRVAAIATRGSYRALRWSLGPGRPRAATAATANALLWAGASAVGYRVGLGMAGEANSTVDPGYDRPPSDPWVSGSPASGSAFDELGRQGRRFVVDQVRRADIARVMGEAALADPIRVYVGYDSEPLYPTGRAEQALEELERTGAFDRGHLLLVSPTGTGWVNHQVVEAAELLTRGDIATCAIQYGTHPSFLALQNVALGRSQFRILLLGVRQRLRAIPEAQRPRVLVFGYSLGAWTASDVIMDQGIGGFDHYGIDTALWMGLPWLAKWSRSGMVRGSSELVPEGTVGVFDRFEQLAGLTDAERARLRAVVLSHDNDPIALLGPDLLVQPPRWLQSGERGRGVPADMRWSPVVTFLQTAVDAANSMVQVPGQFTSYGHDYRADVARFVHAAYRLPDASSAQVAEVERFLVAADLARARRLGLVG